MGLIITCNAFAGRLGAILPNSELDHAWIRLYIQNPYVYAYTHIYSDNTEFVELAG